MTSATLMATIALVLVILAIVAGIIWATKMSNRIDHTNRIARVVRRRTKRVVKREFVGAKAELKKDAKDVAISAAKAELDTALPANLDAERLAVLRVVREKNDALDRRIKALETNSSADVKGVVPSFFDYVRRRREAHKKGRGGQKASQENPTTEDKSDSSANV
jgi:hypothetical protein